MTDLEETPVECSINSSTDKKVNKRRSSIFKRQSIAPRDEDLEHTEEIIHESKKFKHQSENEPKKFDILKYIETLKEEDKNWREVYAKRKSRVQDLVKRDKNQEQTLDITCLSNFERAFLAMKPDFEEFNRNLFQLHAMTTKVTFLSLCAENFYVRSTLKLQSDTDNAMCRIINLTE